MNVPFHLRRREETSPAVALFLGSRRISDLVKACTQVGGARLPVLYAVADGFVLKLHEQTIAAFPGLVRLRGLSENLLLPVDADLVPGLLAEEATALVRDRGLVFLPGDLVLAFTPDRPLSLASLVAVTEVRRENWRPLPEPPPLPDRIQEVLLESSEESAEEILEQGSEGIGVETARPPDAHLPAAMMGRAALGLGKTLAWLGATLGLSGLAGLGARLAGKAVEMVPRLSESLLGRQEAAMRELLRLLRSGNIERALRHALPLDDSARGPSLAGNANLPDRDPRYRLLDLLANRSGPGGVWITPAQMYQELWRQYVRLAEEALRRGDFRRAAFIHAHLLRDFRQAAAALARGRLHHDAAVIYLKKLDDTLAAAREFEAAGEIDRALELYRQHGEHEMAGDLLRRAGEEEQALGEYEIAAARLFNLGRAYQAGELMGQRARREDLARPYYEHGWAARPHLDALACAIRLAQWRVRQDDLSPLMHLIAEAEDHIDVIEGTGPSLEFFHELARLAGPPLPATTAADLRDRALQRIARRLHAMVKRDPRNAAEAGNWMARPGLWPQPIISDAVFALKALAQMGRTEPRLR